MKKVCCICNEEIREAYAVLLNNRSALNNQSAPIIRIILSTPITPSPLLLCLGNEFLGKKFAHIRKKQYLCSVFGGKLTTN